MLELWAQLISGELKGEQLLVARYAMAEHVRTHLERWVPPEAPMRPLSVPENERTLRAKVRFARTARASPDDARMLADLGLWRYAVWQQQSLAAANLSVLLDAIDAYDAVLAQHDDASVRALRTEVAEFLSDRWGVNEPYPDRSERRSYVERMGRAAVGRTGLAIDAETEPLEIERQPEQVSLAGLVPERDRRLPPEVEDE